jgi:hypothetical protein
LAEGYDWGKLNHMQLGRYAEYFVKMEFSHYGFDVYTAEVDEKASTSSFARIAALAGPKWKYRYYDVQAKSVRRLNYIFVRKDKLVLRDNLLVAVALLKDGKLPRLYQIPATAAARCPLRRP